MLEHSAKTGCKDTERWKKAKQRGTAERVMKHGWDASFKRLKSFSNAGMKSNSQRCILGYYRCFENLFSSKITASL